MVGTTEPPAPGEKRDWPRRRVLLTGLIANDDLSVSFRCAIRNRSEPGANLRLPKGQTAPDAFWLIEVQEGKAYRATAIWKTLPDIGVTLADPVDLHSPTEDLFQHRLRALWLEAAPRGRNS
jgi:hypothetical protein